MSAIGVPLNARHSLLLLCKCWTGENEIRGEALVDKNKIEV